MSHTENRLVAPRLNNTITLVSHRLCPYVQRAAIVLAEKGIAFERIDIDLADKPSWFLDISPLGKTPVLLVEKHAIFESAVICEYLDEVFEPRLHPVAPLDRAYHRGWIEFATSVLNLIGAFYNAKDRASLEDKARLIKQKFGQLEAVLNERTSLSSHSFFYGETFSIVDAAFAPVFRYFDLFEQLVDFEWFHDTPKLNQWRLQLSQQTSVQKAVSEDYLQALSEFVANRNSVLSQYVMK